MCNTSTEITKKRFFEAFFYKLRRQFSIEQLKSINFTPLYFLLMMLGTAVGFGKSLAFAKVLSVDDFGYFALFNIGVSYSEILFQFGLLNGLNRELPVIIGMGEYERAINIRNVVVTCISILVALFSSIFVAAFFWVDLESNIKPIYLVAIGTGAISVFYQIIVLELKGLQLLLQFSFIYLFQASMVLIVGIASGMLWGLKGAIAAVLLSYIAPIAISSKLWIKKVRIVRPQVKQIKYLLRIGIPLVLSTFCYTAVLSMDRIFITKNYGVYELGQYQFASLVFVAGASLAGIVTQWIFPQIMYNHGKNLAPAKNLSLLLTIMAAVFILLLIGWYPFVLISSFLVERLFPRYVSTLPLMQIFYFAGGMAVTNLAGGMINVFNKQFLGLLWTVGVTVVLLLFYFAAALNKASMMIFAEIFLMGQILFVVMNIGIGVWCVRNYN